MVDVLPIRFLMIQQNRHLNILLHSQNWNQMIRLKYKSDFSPAEHRHFLILQCCDIPVVHDYFSIRNRVDTAHDMQQCGLAGARRSDHCQTFSFLHGQIHIIERPNPCVSASIYLRDMFHLYNIHVNFPPDILIFVFLFLYWSNSFFSASLLLPVFLFFLLEQIFFFSTFPPIQLASPFLALGDFPLFWLFAPIQLTSLFSTLEDFPLFWLFPPIQLASFFFLLEQIFCFSTFPPIQLASSFCPLE